MKNLCFFISFVFLGPIIPDSNKKIIQYVDKVIGHTVDRGECWDLAAAALQYAGAYHDRSTEKSLYVFGKKINPKKDKVFAGDIIQIENVQIEYTKGNAIYTESMTHHTAIIYEVISDGEYKIAHQNTSFSGKKVGISELKLKNIKKGSIIFYRPIQK